MAFLESQWGGDNCVGREMDFSDGIWSVGWNIKWGLGR